MRPETGTGILFREIESIQLPTDEEQRPGRSRNPILLDLVSLLSFRIKRLMRQETVGVVRAKSARTRCHVILAATSESLSSRTPCFASVEDCHFDYLRMGGLIDKMILNELPGHSQQDAF
uniref:Uncharacterized protein n=1 Tax=Entomoneis paludosa TaxID=265537 RepID=A0A7S2VBG3_9STRA|mmetsp:Transcript_14904/g.30709  ORF Transcript_14904/g.30709 Transcript_14904/m.30709 type:complete len:120 (+) Transcript_14904:83-442(+)